MICAALLLFNTILLNFAIFTATVDDGERPKDFLPNLQNSGKLNSTQNYGQNEKRRIVKMETEDAAAGEDDQKAPPASATKNSLVKLFKKVKMEPIFNEEKIGEKIPKGPLIGKRGMKIEPKIEPQTNTQQPTKLAVIKQEQNTEEGDSSKQFDDQSTDLDECEQQKYTETDWPTDDQQQSSDDDYNDNDAGTEGNEKLKIIKNFDKMRAEIKSKGGYKSEQRVKIEGEIARELGTNRDQIYSWKRELGQIQRTNVEYDEKSKMKIIKIFDKAREQLKSQKKLDWNEQRQIYRKIANKLGTTCEKISLWKNELFVKEDKETKLRTIEAFDRMRKEHKLRNDYRRENRAKIECEIAKELGTHRDKIYKWKREFFPSAKNFSPHQKRQIIEQFDKIKEKFLNEFKMEMTKKIEEKIAQKFDICLTTIHNWKKQFGQMQSKKHKYSEAEKLKIIWQFDELTMQNSEHSNNEIAEQLPVAVSTIRQWKRQMSNIYLNSNKTNEQQLAEFK